MTKQDFLKNLKCRKQILIIINVGVLGMNAIGSTKFVGGALHYIPTNSWLIPRFVYCMHVK
jgi:hypothetical protein